MDIATAFGIVVGFFLVVGAILMGGAVDFFVNIPGLMIVLGGTFAAICVTCPLSEIWQAIQAAIKVFRNRKLSANEVVNTMVRIAEISRKEGLLALENVHTENAILKKACQLIADNADPTMISNSLRIEINSMKRRHLTSQEVFKKMSSYAPAFGMIGTLIGLIQMLARLDDPQSIGPAMAVALITTFYGAFLSNMLFLPLAGKLKSRSLQETLHLEIIFEGARSILENNNPRIVYETLSSFVAPSERRHER
ncbi:MAG: motility protein A [Deltaproteobacteria bacterium]|nr:motility protein A [Deltaproteobacteria bacterium]